MEGITIHLDDGHESRVIQTYTPHGAIRQMTIAELDTKSKEMRITSIYPQSTSETVVLTEDAMQNLVRFYGEPQAMQADINPVGAYDDKCAAYEEAKSEIAALEQVIATMQSQESFRMTLLESVVSAARVVYAGWDADESLPDIAGLKDLWNALRSLDKWQPEATPAAPAGNDGYCPKCGNIVVLKNGHCHLCGGPTWESLDEYEATRADYLSTHAAPAEDVPNPDEDLEQYERDKAEVQA